MIAKLNSKKFFFSSTLALGVIAVTGIANVPAQAATILGELEWDNGTSDFIDDVDFTGGSFDVTFSPANLGGQAAVFIATQDFAPFFPNLPDFFPINGGNGATGNFDFVQALNIPNVQAAAEFELDGDLTFDFGNGVTATLPDGSIFIGELLNDGSVEFEKEVGQLEFTATGFDNTIAAATEFEFGQVPDAPGVPSIGGGYEVEGITSSGVVPEPASILGLLAVGGLGMAMKRKKQS